MDSEYQTGDHRLMFDLRGNSWAKIPDDLWHNIIMRFAAEICDGVSFDCIKSPDQIHELSVFSEHTPKYIGTSDFQPNSIPATVTDPENYRQPVATFEFDEWIAKLILDEPMNFWCCSNHGIHADELLFWSHNVIKLHAIPWEGLAYFEKLTLDELRLLKNSDARIEKHLYSE